MVTVFIALTTSSRTAERPTLIPKWQRFEASFQSRTTYANPVQDVTVSILFTSPAGDNAVVPAFWDGGKTWRVRFSPDRIGRWLYTTVCSDQKNSGLHAQSGRFTCTATLGQNVFAKHGPVRVGHDGHSLAHEDGTPFFWLADTAWNGALLSSAPEWRDYIQVRRSQGFNAVQWVTTQWRAAPAGNQLNQLAYSGKEAIQINPAFFQELDRKVEALNAAGILNVPVLLWAHPGQEVPKVSPGFALTEDQAIVLARYMVARWGANDVAWILGG
ncbi:MAG TPA: DUF5060 domain-containing protein, partial [Verrucomicrobiae bacterium]|nr:DUF5060 domain-containing protein [Verrucomicrobiae bacterium]